MPREESGAMDVFPATLVSFAGAKPFEYICELCRIPAKFNSLREYIFKILTEELSADTYQDISQVSKTNNRIEFKGVKYYPFVYRPHVERGPPFASYLTYN